MDSKKIIIAGCLKTGKTMLIRKFLRLELADCFRCPIVKEYYFSERERVEVYFHDNKVAEFLLNEMQNLTFFTENCIAKIFINNTNIEDLINKNCVLVEMPSIPTEFGDYANDYIAKQVHKLIVFVVDVFISRESTNFIDEYLEDISLIVSYSDRFMSKDKTSIKEYFKEKYPSTEMGFACGVNSEDDDFIKLMKSLLKIKY